MKSSQIQQALLIKGRSGIILFFLIYIAAGCRNPAMNPTPKVSTVITGLEVPMGIETDQRGDIWVAETGTAKNDGKVVVVTKNHGMFQAYDAIVNLSSIKNALSNEDEGPAHLLLDHNMLFVLAGDYLYSVNLANFKPGDAPLDGSKLPFEDIGSWVRSQNIVTPNDSHPYDLTKGPDGKLYITDAGANAIIRRNAKDNYTILAKFPNFPNPTQVGPPVIQRVPTGIIWDGHEFLVTTLTGFPFVPGQAVIYKVSIMGNVSVCSQGLSTLVDIAPQVFLGIPVLSYGSFGQTGFEPKTGSLSLVMGNYKKEIVSGINMPVGIKQINGSSWYISSMGDGSILKVTYNY